jgi:hypothetical protein
MGTRSSGGSTSGSFIWPTLASGSSTTGVRYFSAMLKARTVSSQHSCAVAGAMATMGWSPWVPQRACITSDWPTSVGPPVDGPPRMTLTTTSGISRMQA